MALSKRNSRPKVWRTGWRCASRRSRRALHAGVFPPARQAYLRGTIGHFILTAAFAACAVIMSRDGGAGFTVWLRRVLGGAPAYMRVYNIQYMRKTLTQRQIYAVRGKTAYVITETSAKEHYADDRPTFEAMIAQFKFLLPP